MYTVYMYTICTTLYTCTKATLSEFDVHASVTHEVLREELLRQLELDAEDVSAAADAQITIGIAAHLEKVRSTSATRLDESLRQLRWELRLDEPELRLDEPELRLDKPELLDEPERLPARGAALPPAPRSQMRVEMLVRAAMAQLPVQSAGPACAPTCMYSPGLLSAIVYTPALPYRPVHLATLSRVRDIAWHAAASTDPTIYILCTFT